MMAKKFNFASRSEDEIRTFLRHTWPDIDVGSEPFLHDPNKITHIYYNFLVSNGCKAEKLKELAQGVNTSEWVHPDQHTNTDLPTNITAIMNKCFIKVLHLKDFSYCDVVAPTRKRSLSILSAIVNFMLFKLDSPASRYFNEVKEDSRKKLEKIKTFADQEKFLKDELIKAKILDQEDSCKRKHNEKLKEREKDEIIEAKEKISEMKSKLAESKETSNKLMQELLLSREEIVKMREMEDLLREQIVKNPKQIGAEVEMSAKQLENVKEKRDTLIGNIMKLKDLQKQHNDNIRRINVDSATDLILNDQQIKKIEEELEDLEKLNDKLEKSMEEMDRQLGAHEQSLVNMKSQLRKLNNLIKYSSKALSDELDATKKKGMEFEKEIDEEERNFNGFNTKIEMLNNDVKELEKKASESKEVYRKKLQSIKTDLENFKNEMKQQVAYIDARRKEVMANLLANRKKMRVEIDKSNRST